VLPVEDVRSRGEAARVLNAAPSTAVRWLNRCRSPGNGKAKPGTGHPCSPLKACADLLLALVATEPDLTLEESLDRLSREKQIAVAVSSVWRFFDRYEITYFKKVLHATEQDRPDVAAARARLKARQAKLSQRRLVSVDETAVTTKITCL
jgi:transposase